MTEQVKKQVFEATAELRRDYELLKREYGIDEQRVWKACARYCGAIDILQALGGMELEDEFIAYYNSTDWSDYND